MKKKNSNLKHVNWPQKSFNAFVGISKSNSSGHKSKWSSLCACGVCVCVCPKMYWKHGWQNFAKVHMQLLNTTQFKQRHEHCLFEMPCSVQTHSMCIQQYVHVRSVMRIVCWTDKTIVRGLHNIGRVSWISLLSSTYYYMNINQHYVCAFRWWLHWCCTDPKPTFPNILIRFISNLWCIPTMGGHGCLWHLALACAAIFGSSHVKFVIFAVVFIGALAVTFTNVLHVGEHRDMPRT